VGRDGRKLSGKERRVFPEQLEGVPVEIQQSGPFVALPGTSKKGPKTPEKSSEQPR
jgi:hypothetical protein